MVTSDYKFQGISALDTKPKFLSGEDYSRRDMRLANLSGITFKDVFFERTDLRRASFVASELTRCVFHNSQLGRLDLSDTYLQDCDFTDANAVCLFAPRSAIEKVNLSCLKGVGASFSKTIFRSCQFLNAILTQAIFSEAVMSECDMSGAFLLGADFSSAKLRNVSFKNADLRFVTFSGAILEQVDFTGAYFGKCVSHVGASFIGCQSVPDFALEPPEVHCWRLHSDSL